jgi:hypothetical protein
MLSSLLLKRPTNYNYNNINFKEYCMNTGKKSILKISEKHNLEKNKLKIINPLDEEKVIKYNFIYHSIFVFLSLTIYTLTFYKRT